MKYPLLSEYKEAIRNAEVNFSKLSNLRSVLDSSGAPVMIKGNIAVVFKMTDGNLHEWCKDWRGHYPYWAQFNPAGPTYGIFRVTRGGNYYFDAESCRVSSRSMYAPDRGIPGIGLRLGLSKF